MLDKAINLASIATMDVYDKFGKPYILTCISIMKGVEEYGEDYMIVGVLSKVIEKKLLTIEKLIEEKFNEFIIRILQLFTDIILDNKILEEFSEKNTPNEVREEYELKCFYEYIKSLSKNKVSRKVKLFEISLLTKPENSKILFNNLLKYHNAYDILKSYDISNHEEISQLIKHKNILLTKYEHQDLDEEHDEEHDEENEKPKLIKYHDENNHDYIFDVNNHEWRYD